MDHAKYLSSISSLIDPRKCMQTLKNEKCIEEREMRILCEKAKEILLEEPNVQSVALPALIVGDIHGQFHDLMDILSKCESDLEKESIRIVFMGDFVDRGYYSVETFEYLLCLKLLHPGNVILLRGNHESRQITMAYGFYDEINKKYGNFNVWKYCVEVFDCLSISCLLENKLFCVHAGLSPEIPAIDLIQEIDRRMEIPHEGPFSDLMWSDPEDIEKWSVNQRGAGWLFGSKVVDKVYLLISLIISITLTSSAGHTN